MKKKVVYIFLTAGGGLSYLANNIIPQLEANNHSFEVVGMVFFGDNQLILSEESLLANRLTNVVIKYNIVLMLADIHDLTKPGIENQPNPAVKMLKPTDCAVIVIKDSIQVGCFPGIYSALQPNRPHHIISL